MSLGPIRKSSVNGEESFCLLPFFFFFHLMNYFASVDFEMGALLGNERLKYRT